MSKILARLTPRKPRHRAERTPREYRLDLEIGPFTFWAAVEI